VITARCTQTIYLLSVTALAWLGMMAVHEVGHVIGACITGGQVNRVFLHPAAISRTDVAPNPSPTIVVWAGPILGSLLPLMALSASGLMAQTSGQCRSLLQFFTGFCLVANGAYIGAGAFDGVGDAGEMLRLGTPLWAMLAFGILACALGFWLWHCMGSLKQFLSRPETVQPSQAFALAATLALVIVAGALLSAQS